MVLIVCFRSIGALGGAGSTHCPTMSKPAAVTWACPLTMAEDNKSQLIAVDSFSGNIVWRSKRPVGGSWTSPIVANIAGRDQVITCGDPWVISYDPSNGAEIWRADCLGTDTAPSPIYSGDLIFVIKPYSDLVAIKAGGTGDITETHIAWKAVDGIPDITSPVCNGQIILLVETSGYLTCYNVADGKKLWEKELDQSFSASPTLVGDRIYILSEKGQMFIIAAGDEYKELSRCSLDESCYASPAFMDGRIYIRALKNLYCIGKPK